MLARYKNATLCVHVEREEITTSFPSHPLSTFIKKTSFSFIKKYGTIETKGQKGNRDHVCVYTKATLTPSLCKSQSTDSKRDSKEGGAIHKSDETMTVAHLRQRDHHSQCKITFW